MTILPSPVKKRRERDSSQKPGSGDHRQNVGQMVGNGALKRIRKSPRPKENKNLLPPKKKVHLASQVPHQHSLSSPLSSPRSLKSSNSDDASKNQVASSSSSTTENDNNSDDEYELEAARDEQIEKEFKDRLGARGLIIKEMVGDGACMFRAIAEQLYGDQEMHGQIRKLCMDYMSNNRDYFSDFITEDFDHYIIRKRDDKVHGNHAELQAISEMFARPVEVYQYSDQPISILLPRGFTPNGEKEQQSSSTSTEQNAPLRLSYHGAVHYNAIVDPHAATIGVGLGLPGLIPGSADRELLTKAMAKSEQEHIEETMLKDKIDMTDWQRTQADIEDQITRESYMSYLREVEETKKKPNVKEESPSTSRESEQTSGLYEELLAAQSLDWETYNDDVAMAEALVMSQQEFMASQSGPSSSNNK